MCIIIIYMFHLFRCVPHTALAYKQLFHHITPAFSDSINTALKERFINKAYTFPCVVYFRCFGNGEELVLHLNLQSILQMLTAILYYIHLYAMERQILSPSSWKACTNKQCVYIYLRSKWRSKQNQIISIRKHQQWERKLTKKRKYFMLTWMGRNFKLFLFYSCLHIFFAYKWVKFICAPFVCRMKRDKKIILISLKLWFGIRCIYTNGNIEFFPIKMVLLVFFRIILARL